MPAAAEGMLGGQQRRGGASGPAAWVPHFPFDEHLGSTKGASERKHARKRAVDLSKGVALGACWLHEQVCALHLYK